MKKYKCIKGFLLGILQDNGFEDNCECDYTEVEINSEWEIITDIPKYKKIIIKNLKDRKILEIDIMYFKKHFKEII